MPHFTIPVDPKEGPVLKILIAVSEARSDALVKAQELLPNPVLVVGLVDTGASCTCVDTDIISQLDIPVSGNTKVYTPSTGNQPMDADQFDIGLAIFASEKEQPHLVRNLPVVGCDFKDQGYKVLIGRDVLSRCMLVYNGILGQYTLAF